MRIGIIALLHESNTFSAQPTTLESFRQNLLLSGDPIRAALADAHHEVGGFFGGLDAAGAEAVPLFAARALPSGTIQADTFEALANQLLDCVRNNLPLDGLLVAPHGATVSERYPDAQVRFIGVRLGCYFVLQACAAIEREKGCELAPPSTCRKLWLAT